MPPSVPARLVAVDHSISKGLVAAFSDGTRNGVGVLRGAKWELQHEWKGAEVTAFCICGDAVVVGELGGSLRVLGREERVLYDTGFRDFGGAVALSAESALLGGNKGRLSLLNLDTLELTRIDTSGIQKRGRDIRNVVRSASHVFLVGDNSLLVRFDASGLKELLDPSPRPSEEPELRIHHVAYVAGSLLISGLSGLVPILGSVEHREVRLLDTPPLGIWAPPVYSWRERLFLLTETLWERVERQWRFRCSVGPGDALIGMVQLEGDRLMVVSEVGLCFREAGGNWERVA